MDAARRDTHTDSTHQSATTDLMVETTAVWDGPPGGDPFAAPMVRGDFDGPEYTLAADSLMAPAPYRKAAPSDSNLVPQAITGDTAVGEVPKWTDLRTQIATQSPRFSPIGFLRPASPTQKVPAPALGPISCATPETAASPSLSSAPPVANLAPAQMRNVRSGQDHSGALASVSPNAARGGSDAAAPGSSMRDGGGAAVFSPGAVEAMLPPAMDQTAILPTAMDEPAIPTASLRTAGTYLGSGEGPGKAFSVMHGESFEIGRKPGSAFADDPHVERYHAALTPADDGFIFEDFGSTNGVFIRVDAPRLLADGDQIRIGQQLLQLRLLEVPAQTGTQAIGCPDPGYWGRLDMLLRPELVAASFPIDHFEAVIGDEAGDLQFPDDPFIAREHCRVQTVQGGVIVEDLGSTAGTFVRLQSGDHVASGSTLLIGQTLLEVGPTNQ